MQFHPRNWNIGTWLVFVVWFAFTLLTNIPHDPADFADEVADVQFEGMTLTAYETHFAYGWPLTYVEMIRQRSGPTRKFYKPFNIIINVALIALTQIAIIYGIQKWMPRFSICMLFGATTLVALVIVLGKLTLYTDNYILITTFFMTLYFSPLIGCAILWLYNLRRPNVEIAT